MPQQTLHFADQAEDRCPLCGKPVDRFPGGLRQCWPCSLVFTCTVKPIESTHRRGLQDTGPEAERPPDCSPEVTQLKGSVLKHGAAGGVQPALGTRTDRYVRGYTPDGVPSRFR